MNIYVLDTDFENVAVIDSYTSIIWTVRYFTFGDFELYLSAEPWLLDTLRAGYYLVREEDIKSDGYHNVMIINSREIVTDAENGDNLIVTGYCLKSILRRRVVIDQTVLNGNIQACLRSLLSDNIVSPTDSDRAISNFILGTDKYTDTRTMRKQITGKNLGEVFEELCTQYGIGYDVYINTSKQFVLYLYNGVDRSYAQSVNAHVVVSETFDNLLSSDYMQSIASFANVAIVAGEGEGTERKKVTVGTATGLNRYELWVDARNASSDNGTISDTEYLEMLRADGREALGESDITTTLSGEIINGVSFEINRDYFLGDIIQFENNYGVSASTRVIEVIYNEDETGVNIIPTFAEMEV